MSEIEKYIEELEKALENDEKEKFIRLLKEIRLKIDLHRFDERKLMPFLEKAIEEYNVKIPQFYDMLFRLYYIKSDFKTSLFSKIPKNAYEARIYVALAYFLRTKYKIATIFLGYDEIQKYIYDSIDFKNPIDLRKSLYDLVCPRLLTKIYIPKYYSIKNTTINNINSKEIYFLGANGVGKTIFLQAISSSLKESQLDIVRRLENTDETHNISHSYLEPNNDLVSSRTYQNLFAYGVGRLKTHDNEIDETGYGTLFDQQRINLKHPVRLLEEVERLELKGIGNLKLEKVIKMLTDILNIGDTPNITIEQDGAKFIFKEHGTPVEFKHLADGYRSILLILADLLSRLAENQPHIDKIEDFRGIVLIDEIDMLLHPKWEYVIVKKLREKLPNIQWFLTTHSPMLVLGASTDAIFYRLYKENGETKISQQYTYDDIKNVRSDGIITSPLFGMEYAGMREELNKPSDSVDTSETWLAGRIHQEILKRYEAEKAQRNTDFIEEDEITDWINEALDENQSA